MEIFLLSAGEKERRSEKEEKRTEDRHIQFLASQFDRVSARQFPYHSHGCVYQYHAPLLASPTTSLTLPHVTSRGFANMAPLPNRPRRKHPPRPPLHSSPSPSPQSIIQVTLVCISGYVLARRGILDKTTQKVVTFISHHFLLTDSSVHSQQLNIINVNFFTPCLLFSKVAFFLSPGPPQSS
jgi:hypothetical protein